MHILWHHFPEPFRMYLEVYILTGCLLKRCQDFFLGGDLVLVYIHPRKMFYISQDASISRWKEEEIVWKIDKAASYNLLSAVILWDDKEAQTALSEEQRSHKHPDAMPNSTTGL